MGKALYRKYRSTSLDEIVGQPHITATLKNALKNDSVSHAYLFTGPRGVGKTSIARILAHAINDLPYAADANHLDIIEIDAASNRRIDEIRELRERVHSAPTSAKYKVYIIDEVHMLTKEAFNALLKTLEEPPAHVVFILATTEAHKLPETIVSRTQRLTFKPVDRQAVIDHLRHISEQESIDVSDDALGLIADYGEGSFRDSISLLDQARAHSNPVGLTDVQTIVGIAPDQVIDLLFEAVTRGDVSSIVTVLGQANGQGYQPPQLAKQLAAKIRNQLLSGEPVQAGMTALLRQLIEVPASHDSTTTLELALIEAALPVSVQQPVKQPAPVPEPATAAVDSAPKHAEPSEPKPSPKAAKSVQPKAATATSASRATNSDWDTVLQTIKQQYNTLYSVVRMAEPTFEGDSVTLSFAFAFHQKRINESKNKQIIVETLEQVLGRPVTVNCVTSASPKKSALATVSKPDNTITTISNIFGSAEVLE